MGVKILLCSSIALVLTGCFGSAPPLPNREKTLTTDGKWLEERIVRNLSRRPEEIYHVYRDTSGNYIRHGSDTHFYLDGQIKFEEHYRNGLLDSITEFWYPNGAKRGELRYKDGKPDGKAISWFPDGKKQSEKTWENGFLNGPCFEWDEKGTLIKKTVWNRNKIQDP